MTLVDDPAVYRDRQASVSPVRPIAANAKDSSREPRLAILVPFRDDAGQDPLSQGIGRWKNLEEFVPIMTDWLSKAGRNFKIIVIEQAPGSTFNKGALFNAGVKMNPDFDYYALHDVDQVPTHPDNTYAMPMARPVHLCSSTGSKSKIKRFSYDIVGGVLLITRAQYLEVNGYSNKFGGWGQEDQDMAHRLKKALGGYDRLPAHIGHYKALHHERVMGLDETAQFKANGANLHSTIRGTKDSVLAEGLSTVKFSKRGHDRTVFGAKVQTVAFA